MKITAAAATVAIAAMACVCAVAGERLEIQGATSARYLLAPHVQRIRAASDVEVVVAPVGTAQAMLDLIEGRSQAAVVTTSLADAVAAARVAAWTGERRLLPVSASLTYYPIVTGNPDARPLGFVTMAAPSPQLARVIEYLNSDAGYRALER